MTSLSGSGMNTSSGGAKLSARYSIPFQYAAGACRLEQRARMLEQSHTLTELEATEHRALVVAAVSQSVAAFESDLTELWMHGAVMPDPADTVNKLKGIKKSTNDGVLARWNLALVALCKNPIGTADPLYQETQLLVDMRNELTHYASDWDGRTKKGLVPKFATKTFNPPAWLVGANIWPLYLLHADLAAWSCKTALAFLADVYERLGAKSQIDLNRAASIEVAALFGAYNTP